MECRSYTTARPLLNAVTISWSPNEIPTVPHCPSGQELFDDFRGPPRDFRVGSLVLTPLGKTNDFKHELGFLVTLVFLNLSSALALTSHPFLGGSRRQIPNHLIQINGSITVCILGKQLWHLETSTGLRWIGCFSKSWGPRPMVLGIWGAPYCMLAGSSKQNRCGTLSFYRNA